MALNGKAPMGVELVKKGVVTESDIQTAIEYQKEHPDKKIGDILNILNLCPQAQLIKAMGEILSEKVIILRPDNITINVTEYMSLDVCKSCKAIIFDVIGSKAKVCFADTANKRAIEQVRLILLNRGLVMEKYLTFESAIDTVIESLDGKAGGSISATGDVTGLIDTIIKTAMEKRASDIHIEPLENTIRIRYRIDGELVTVASIDKQRLTQVIGRLKAISNMHQEKQESQDRKNYNVFRV